jgi:hypothetical protein
VFSTFRLPLEILTPSLIALNFLLGLKIVMSRSTAWSKIVSLVKNCQPGAKIVSLVKNCLCTTIFLQILFSFLV